MIGSRARIKQPKFLAVVWSVIALEEGRSFTWVTRAPGLIVTAHHAVEATDAGSRATLSVQYSGPLESLVGWLTRGVNDRYLAMEAAGLKRRSEEGIGGGRSLNE